MAEFTYFGFLTDIGVNVLTDRVPELAVRPKQSLMRVEGPVASSRVVVPVDPVTGRFEMELIASKDLTPPSNYLLEVGYFGDGSAMDALVGWDQWEFTAVIGGGNVGEMSTAPPIRLFIGPPWPSAPTPGVFLDAGTGDLGFYNVGV